MQLEKLYESVTQFHENKTVIKAVASRNGRLIIWFVATLALIFTKWVYAVSPVLLLFAFFPEKRNYLLCLGSIWIAHHQLSELQVPGIFPMALDIAAVIGLIYLVYKYACSFRTLPIWLRRFPQAQLHIVMLLALIPVVAYPAPENSELSTWYLPLKGFVLLLPFLIWRLNYIVQSGIRGTAGKSGFTDHLFYALPTFGGTNTPQGKGHDFLSRHICDTDETIAKSQLAGLKLIALYWMWNLVQEIFIIVIYGEPGQVTSFTTQEFTLALPRLSELMATFQNVDQSVFISWATLYIDFFDLTITLAIMGHAFVGCIRLFGYNVFRNTYKPLLAESIIDFWNRFYYYFKELLVEFFSTLYILPISKRAQNCELLRR